MEYGEGKKDDKNKKPVDNFVDLGKKFTVEKVDKT